MARRVRVHKSLESLRSELDERLRAFHERPDNLSLREKILLLVPVHDLHRSLGVSVGVAEGLSARSGMKRVLEYLQRHVATVIDGVELDIVSGISEYARRIRQLRVEEGFRILSGASPDAYSEIDLKPDQYILTAAEPDLTAAKRWLIANRVRKLDVSVQDRLLQYFKENVQKVVTTEELAYVARDRHEFGRRARELRTEEGYAVATKFSGRPDLRAGEYILLSVDRVAEQHDRHISETTQKAVYARDNSTCQLCGWEISRLQSDPRFLELHHINMHANRGANEATNLVVLCNICHDDVHAGRRNNPPPR